MFPWNTYWQHRGSTLVGTFLCCTLNIVITEDVLGHQGTFHTIENLHIIDSMRTTSRGAMHGMSYELIFQMKNNLERT